MGWKTKPRSGLTISTASVDSSTSQVDGPHSDLASAAERHVVAPNASRINLAQCAAAVMIGNYARC